MPLRDVWVAGADFNEIYLVFQRFDTDLSRVLRDATQPLSVAHVRYFLYQILLATAYMHSCAALAAPAK